MEQIKDIMKQVVTCLASQTSNMENLDGEEFKNACDGVKDLAMANYYCSITDAMEESEYGVDYDENGKKYYTKGMRTRTPMMMYDNAKAYPTSRAYYDDSVLRGNEYNQGRMYYTEMPMESRHDRAKRYYTEAKATKPTDKAEHTEKLNKFLGEIEDEVKPMVKDMSPEEKAIAKQKFMSWYDMIM